MQVSGKYAIESCYLGENPPWQGWMVTRRYATQQARDEDLIRLRRTCLSRKWLYRVKS
jgi:hypothetical protein